MLESAGIREMGMKGRSLVRLAWGVGLVSLSLCVPPLAAETKPETSLARRAVEASAEPAPLAASGEDSPRHGFFRRLGGDFARFAAPGNLVVLGAGGLAGLAVHPWDRQLTEDLHRSDTFDAVFEAGAVSGNGYVQGGLALGAFLTGRLAHSRELAGLGGDLIRAQIVSGAVTTGLKLAVGRQRPDGSTRLSFPSGHTSSTFATATVLERRYGWKVGIPAYGLAAYVAVSRLQENKHFASDVLVGAAIGIAAGRAVVYERGNTRLQLAPFAVPGGVGVALVGSGR